MRVCATVLYVWSWKPLRTIMYLWLQASSEKFWFLCIDVSVQSRMCAIVLRYALTLPPCLSNQGIGLKFSLLSKPFAAQMQQKSFCASSHRLYWSVFMHVSARTCMWVLGSVPGLSKMPARTPGMKRRELAASFWQTEMLENGFIE